ncbi:autotransporter-associated beta strand repeat-containing protein [Aeoliella sp. SH292]|uniref:autotransporter-associated beta strand repeat-containing protein n=1 Tax=Aeoliella sp. SH292 TaxID=3454464 RepID=UPI003F9E313D
MRTSLLTLAVATAIAAWSAIPLPAATINYLPTTAGPHDFNTGTNWNGGVVPGTNDVAQMQQPNITAAQTTNVSSTVTLGGMTIGDNSTSGVFKMTVTADPGQKIIFDNPSGNATLSKPSRSNAVGDEISAPIEIASGEKLVATNAASGSGTLTLSGALTGDVTSELSYASAGGGHVLTGDLSGFNGTIGTTTGNSALGGANLSLSTNLINGQNAKFNIASASGSPDTADSVTRFFRYANSALASPGTNVELHMGELSGTGWINPQSSGGLIDSYNYYVGYLGTDSTYSGTIIHRGAASGAGNNNFTKVGTGSLTLSGANAFNGTVTVSAGTLVTGANVHNSSISATLVDMPDGDTITLTDHGLNVGDRLLFSGSPSGMINTANYVVHTVVDANSFKVALANSPAVIDSATAASSAMQATLQSPLGSGTTPIQMGDANTGSSDIGLLISGAFFNKRDINLTSNGTGTATIGGNTDSNSSYMGDISLGRAVQLTSATTGGNTVTFSGELSGVGGVAKVGLGSVTLTEFNTYTGDTAVEQGNLILSQAYLADTASVLLDSSAQLTLGFSEIDLVNAFAIDGMWQRAGTHGAIGSGADWESALLSGPGMLLVVPEPSSIALALLAGIGGLATVRRGRVAGGPC